MILETIVPSAIMANTESIGLVLTQRGGDDAGGLLPHLDGQHRGAVLEARRTAGLDTNLAYATAMARMLYWRKPEALPAADDIPGLAAYWKRHYNTAAGRGKPADFAQALERCLA